MMELQICNRKGETLKAYPISDRSEMIIGREEHCDVRIGASSISREHCMIEHVDNSYILRDLDSTTGTRVNGKSIDAIQIHHGLEIQIGPAVLKFLENQS
ncbi:MAG: hypothetical protein CMJ32_00820 [Phycisphaerae bacterium]|nr:hypothetical protein [Phycisphaerae bacterium]